jgi:hypothetical protein
MIIYVRLITQQNLLLFNNHSLNHSDNKKIKKELDDLFQLHSSKLYLISKYNKDK